MIRAELNETEAKKYLKINETKIWFIEMINNIDKSLATLRTKMLQITKVKNESGGDFPGSPAVDSALPLQGVWV